MYRILWDNGRDCGELTPEFTNKRAAEIYARAWKRDMVALEPAADHAAARAAYQWEIVDASNEKAP
jgi:hypothetical protein